MDVVSALMGRTHGRPGPDLAPDDKMALAEFRRAIWQYGFFGLFTGLCTGVLAAPYMKRFIGPHSNVATPLGFGALFSTLGSAMAAEKQSQSISYAMFKRQESMKAFNLQEQEKRRERLARKEIAAKKRDSY
jgi:hypothetical protein